ncbi:YmaF family protein [Niallia oryzisoli]|uniref:YmaF family protein n=1 Tax=Niallia oryzisoli TaxID=1737571 RepID=A0ABZ2CC89_9BACI
MEIPVSGYMYHSNDSDPMHSHYVYITSWDGRQMQMPTHAHEMRGATTFDMGHNHSFAGRTEPAPTGVQHTHQYFIFTAIADGHIHQIRGMTGPAIPLSGGGHYHEFSGVTTVDGVAPHSHRYSGRTSR